MSLMRIPVIAVLALSVGGCGQSGDSEYATSFMDVAQAAARQSDRVSVEELASWLIEERGDFVLIDVRSPDEVDQGMIGDARNVPIVELMTGEVLDMLPQDRKIVLYSNGSENSAKASVMLRLAGLDAYVLAGGFNAWHARILNPDISAEELDGESLQVSEQRAYACYFVGERSGEGARRPGEGAEFVPPVFEAKEEMAPLPPAKEEGC
jgi:rhodanese-related sulfurtransferase